MLTAFRMDDRRFIIVEGARQNNLKAASVRVPVGAVTAVTGVAGAGKSSLAFDVLYAEGYRRYVETFSPYARQFLERLDRPRADRIAGVLPAVAIDRTSPVRTSRSTVGTMTAVADYLRALYARAADLHCRSCGDRVQRTSASMAYDSLRASQPDGASLLICFRTVGSELVGPDVLREIFAKAGFRRVREDGQVVALEAATLQPRDGAVTVVLDRIRLEPGADCRKRLVDSLEAALRWGKGSAEVHPVDGDGPSKSIRFSQHLRCARCDLEYRDPSPATFSFNNPVGACETCKGFGRTMAIDPSLVVPDPRKSLAEGCLKPFQTPSHADSQDDLMRLCKRHKLPTNVPWNELDETTRQLIWEGEPGGRAQWKTKWYGVQGFFQWLESKSYKMHVRIYLSRFRSYATCAACSGGRLKPDALLFRLGGKRLPDVEALPLADADAFFEALARAPGDAATDLLLVEIRARLRFLVDVGLGYLTLARQSRTLSGGEAQRVSLATALGSSLTSTLYVLDEPSIGLHARDAGRLAGVLRRLALAGNAVVVVEHDPALIGAADHVIDLGPGPGAAGGHVVYAGPLPGLVGLAGSPTGRFLAGGWPSPSPAARRPRTDRRALRIVGARENNLKDVTVSLPLGMLVCITGVSGSGKSTLVDQVLVRNLRRHFGQGESEPGACDRVEGAQHIDQVVLVDQAPLGASSRVNAATYLGVMDPIRSAFAATAEAKARDLKASAFSFNSAAGQCPRCKGAGFEKIELQFLPDAFVRCPACDGRRFRPESLQVRLHGYDVASLLELPAHDVAALFAGDRVNGPKIAKALQPLLDIGLGYLSLAQPATTLSGGETQRLKLAGHLAEAASLRNALFVLDEPTTGLHAADVAVLLQALQKLVDGGHSVLVVEHNLEVAKASDWVIDLGPEGGDGGGQVVGEGPPEAIARLATPTGRALAENLAGPAQRLNTGRASAAHDAGDVAYASERPIRIQGAREHNLKDVSIDLPSGRLVAVTGPSGSGKSTLAFDVLYAEGQRRFLDCLPTYVRQFVRPLARPDVDRVEGVPPTVALEQKLTAGSALATAGTGSEVYHYLRLLFAFIGVPHCVSCGLPGDVVAPDQLAQRVARHFPRQAVTVLAPLVRKKKGTHLDAIAAAVRHGVSQVRIDGVVHDAAAVPKLDRFRLHDVDAVAGVVPAGLAGREQRLADAVARGLALSGGTVVVAARGQDDRAYSTTRACPSCGSGMPMPDPRLFTWSQSFGACAACEGRGREATDDDDAPSRAEAPPCPACNGMRLGPDALAVKIADQSIGDVARLSVRQGRAWLDGLGRNLPPELEDTILPELRTRLAVLDDLGLGYLSLDRAADSLSTGEAQRVRIVAALASNLRGVCYVLDEPTVGLHPRDGAALSRALFGLRDRGNTVILVEHDEGLIRSADHLVDLGPAAGSQGGHIVAAGTPAEVARTPGSLTGRWLRGEGAVARWPRRPLTDVPQLIVEGAGLHNLRDVDVAFPLARLVCVTGVSGSGKSTLVRDVLHRALQSRKRGERLPAGLRSLRGAEAVARVLEVDEAPIGRTPRSVPATYVNVMDPIRTLLATTAEARARGFKANRFSFNVAAGRCSTCEGQGQLRVTMSLLPEVSIPCADCAGRRYNPDTLAVTYKDRSIAEILAMTVDEARAFFAPVTAVRQPLDFLAELGLGYLQLGQASPTLSGGEAQRIKLAAELASPGSGQSVYLLDEPTTGLHMADVARLVNALHRLVDRGDTVIVVEHNLDLIAASDCVIDLGPDGGEGGGQIMAWGTPERVAVHKTSRTAPFLRQTLEAHRGRPRATPEPLALTVG